VPLPAETLDLARAEVKSLKLDRMMPILKELGFNRYQEELRALLGGAPMPASSGAGTPTGPVQQARPRPSSGPIGGLFEHLDQPSTTARADPRGEYTCVRTREELSALVERLRAAPAIAIDTETTCLSPTDANLCGISLSIEPGKAFYIPIRSPSPEKHLDEMTVLEALRPLIEDQSKPKLGHNLKYDLLVLRRAGVELRGLSAPGSCDSMIASYLIDSSRSSHSLEALSLALLKQGKGSISELIGSGRQQRSFESVPLEDATCYAAMDADLSFQLAQVMLPQLRALGLMDLFQNLEMPLVEVLAELEWNGILVDPSELDHQRDRLMGRIKELLTQIQDRAMESIGRTFDPDSPKQLGAALFNKPTDQEPGLGIKPLRKTKTGYSTDAEVLEKLAADPDLPTTLPKLILEYRQLTKLVSTYLVALKDAINPQTHRVHTSFNQTVAATGRLASSDPNLQNIPIRTDIGRDIRKAFIAPPGCVLISADYSQIELRLLAHLSKDPALNEAFHRGEDIHTAVAAQIHGIPIGQVTKDQRAGAKMVNFGIVYGITPYGLARRLGIGDKEAAVIIDGYKRKFSGISTFLEECIAQAKRYGFVETMMKRRRPIPDINSANPSTRSLAERMAINSVVQGSAADLIKLAMVDLHRRLRTESLAPPSLRGSVTSPRMLLQIHDELVFESPEALAENAKALIVERMESAMQLSVPLKADASIGKNWFEGK
jgi:DNA polymerase-1